VRGSFRGGRPLNHTDIKVRDSNGAQLADGDIVILIKDLKLKRSSTVLKRGHRDQ
jgi:uncharacterized Zn ribbon protein